APVFSLSGPNSWQIGTTAIYTVTRGLTSGETVLNTETAHWAASGDLTSSGTLTFAPGDSTASLELAMPSGNGKHVTVTISSPSDGATLGTSFSVTTNTTNPAGIAGEPV